MPTPDTWNLTVTCTVDCVRNGTTLCTWASSPGTRGTFDILSLCLSTLGLCVWNAMHPDVPRPGSSRWKILGKRLWWLIVGLFMPEMLVLVALAQFLAAYQLLIRVSTATSAPTKFPYWMTRFEQLRQRPMQPDTAMTARSHQRSWTLSSHSESQRLRSHPWTLTHSFYAVTRGFVNPDGSSVDEDDIIAGMDVPPNNPQYIPDISANDIQERSNANALAKALLIWQLSVFLANCAARWHSLKQFPITLLEITTLAHCLCSLAALAFWWYKPHSVSEATVINPKATPLRPAMSTRSSGSWLLLKDAVQGATRKVKPVMSIGIPQTLTALIIAILYGLPHLLGLRGLDNFPTPVERRLWQIATGTVIASPLVTCFVALFISVPPKRRETPPRAPSRNPVMRVLRRMTVRVENMRRADDTVTRSYAQAVLIGLTWVAFVSCISLYFVCSVFLMAESLRQVFALPEGAFRKPELIRYLPHFS